MVTSTHANTPLLAAETPKETIANPELQPHLDEWTPRAAQAEALVHRNVYRALGAGNLARSTAKA